MGWSKRFWHKLRMTYLSLEIRSRSSAYAWSIVSVVTASWSIITTRVLNRVGPRIDPRRRLINDSKIACGWARLKSHVQVEESHSGCFILAVAFSTVDYVTNELGYCASCWLSSCKSEEALLGWEEPGYPVGNRLYNFKDILEQRYRLVGLPNRTWYLYNRSFFFRCW